MSKKDKYSRERTAIAEFKKLLPPLNSYAKAVAGRELKVLLGASNYTDGKNIYLRPPMELADQSKHDRNYCGQRADNGLLICDGCHVREGVLGGVHHEIAHLVHGSYTKFPNTMVQSILGETIEECLGQQARRNFNKAMLQDREYVWVGEWTYAVAPELPSWVLALEDVRVNAASYKALAGLRAMQFSRYSQVLITGIEQGDGTYYRHTRADADMQVNIAVLFAAQGFEVRGWLADDVVDTIELPVIANLIEQSAGLTNPLDSVELGCKFIYELRKLGYYGEPEPEAFPSPFPPSEDNEEDQGDPGDSGSDAGDSSGDDSSDDPAGDSEEGASGSEEGAADGGAGDAPEGGNEPEDAGPPTEGGDDTADAEDSSGDSGGNDTASGSNADRGNESSDGADPEGGDGGGEPSAGGNRVGLDGDESGSDAGDPGEVEPPGGRGEEESSGADDEHVRDEDARGAGGDEQSLAESGDGGEDASSEDGGDAVRGSADDGNAADNGGLRGDLGPADADEAGSDAGDQANEDGDQPGADDVAADGREAESEDHGESGSADADAGAGGDAPADSDCEPGDADEAGHDQFDAGTQGSGSISGPALEDSTASGDGAGDSAGSGTGAERTLAPRPTSGLDARLDDLMNALAALLGHAMMENEHGHEPSTVYNHTDDDGEAGFGGESDYVTHKMTSQDDLEKVINCLQFLDNISPNLGAPSVKRENEARKGVAPRLAVPGEVNRATYKARLIFAENRRVERHRNQKSGRIKGSILGRRVPVQDVRLFERKTQPDKRDWETLVMLDRSFSTQGDVAVRIRQTAFAIAEVHDRIDVPFSIWTSSTEDIGMWDYGPRWDEIKSVNSHWDRAAQQRLGGAHPISGNLDGHTMQFCRKQLQQSRATDKLLLYFTDGEMPASNYDEELELLQQEIKLMNKLNIHVVGVGMGTDSPKAHGLDTVRVDGPADIGLVIDHLSKVLK